MTEQVNQTACELLQLALKNYDQACQAGLKLQEESAKWWVDFLSQTASPQVWQKKLNSLLDDAIPQPKKRVEESVRLIEKCNRASLDLLKQAVDVVKSGNVTSTQPKAQELWETSLETLRSNTQAMLQNNAKIIEAWFPPYVKGAETPTPKASRTKAA